MAACETAESSVMEIRNNMVPIRRVGWVQNLISLGYEAEEEYLKSVIKQVVVGNSDGVKVSTSIMVYGSPGCGKSQVVDRAIKSIGDEYGQDTYDLVTLDGVFCFSLQDSIMEICDQILGSGNGNVGFDEEISETTPFDERLESILAYLQNTLMETKKSLIVVIDGIEKFVDDSSQRLLYNLFDISANATFSVPICIIGITPCVDILDSFEKRVRSRFSHRQINLIPKVEFSQYQEWVKALLLLPKSDEWNAQVNEVLQDKEVVRVLRLLFDADKSIGQLRRLVYVASLLCDDILTCENIKDAYNQLFGLKCYVQMAIDLPVSELVVLLGIYKKIQRSLQAWQPLEVFEIVKQHYSLYQLRKDDFVKTMMKFQSMHFIIPVGGSQQNRCVCVSNIYESYFKCELSYTEFQDIWKMYPNLPSFFNEYL